MKKAYVFHMVIWVLMLSTQVPNVGMLAKCRLVDVNQLLKNEREYQELVTEYTAKSSMTGITNQGVQKNNSSQKTGKSNIVKATEVPVKIGVGKLSACVVRLNSSKLNITKSKTAVLKLYGSTIKSVATSNPKVATIYKNGLVRANGKGSCNVFVKGMNDKVYICKVNVEIPRLNARKIKIAVGNSFDLNVYGSSKSKIYSIKDKNFQLFSYLFKKYGCYIDDIPEYVNVLEMKIHIPNNKNLLRGWAHGPLTGEITLVNNNLVKVHN